MTHSVNQESKAWCLILTQWRVRFHSRWLIIKYEFGRVRASGIISPDNNCLGVEPGRREKPVLHSLARLRNFGLLQIPCALQAHYYVALNKSAFDIFCKFTWKFSLILVCLLSSFVVSISWAPGHHFSFLYICICKKCLSQIYIHIKPPPTTLSIAPLTRKVIYICFVHTNLMSLCLLLSLPWGDYTL